MVLQHRGELVELGLCAGLQRGLPGVEQHVLQHHDQAVIRRLGGQLGQLALQLVGTIRLGSGHGLRVLRLCLRELGLRFGGAGLRLRDLRVLRCRLRLLRAVLLQQSHAE